MSLADRFAWLATTAAITMLGLTSAMAQAERRQLIDRDQQHLPEQHRTHIDLNEPRALAERAD